MIPRDKSKVIQLRVSEEFREQIETCADDERETISNYIRKAIEQRNTQQKQDEPVKNPVKISSDESTAINYHAAKYKESEKQSKMCHPLTKGGK